MDARPRPLARDPGLQAERTLAAWARTCAALIVNALVLGRAGLGMHGAPANPILLSVGAGICVGAVVLFSLSSSRQTALLSTRLFIPARLEVATVATLTVIIALSAAYAIFGSA